MKIYVDMYTLTYLDINENENKILITYDPLSQNEYEQYVIYCIYYHLFLGI